MRMGAPAYPLVQARAAASMQRAAAGGAAAIPPRPTSTTATPGGAGNLPLPTRQFMETRFGADFGSVRVHTGSAAAAHAKQLDAMAFTTGSDIYFGKGQFRPDTPAGKELIAHELTHTIQQGATKQTAVGASATPAVRERPAPKVHRAGGLLGWLADKANYIPGFRMFTIVLGVNPINMAAVDRSPANIVRAVIEFMPGGKLIGDALESHGILAKIGGWVDAKLRTLGMVGGAIKSAVDKFIDGLGLGALNPFNWGDLWEDAKRTFTEPIDRIKNFVATLAAEIVQLIREAILLPLGALAAQTRGYDLLKAVLGEDPVTGEKVPRTAETLIGGFMKLIGQEEVWENIKKANAVQRCWAWFQSAIGELTALVLSIPGRFVAAFKALDVGDMILIPRAFVKIAAVFGGFLASFVTWAGGKVLRLLEIIFEVVSPATLVYLKKTGAALLGILKNPLPFMRNLVNAAKLGLNNFVDNFTGHLKAGLIDWLTGSLAGVYIPQALSLGELGKFAISVLGITWAQIRGKIVKVLGPTGETIMKGLETGFDVVVALVKGGPAAAWELIKEKLTELKDQVVNGIIGFVTDTIVKKAIPKLVSMFIPGAGFISAIVSIYDTIMVFVEKLAKIVQVVVAFVDSIVAIAAGNIGAAAKRVESVLGNLLSLTISFLAGFLGLGKVTDKIKEVIQKVRASVDKAIDAAIAWIVDKAKKLFGKLFGKKEKKDDPAELVKQRVKDELSRQTRTFSSDEELAQFLGGVYQTYKADGLKSISVRKKKEGQFDIVASASPETIVGLFWALARKSKGAVFCILQINDGKRAAAIEFNRGSGPGQHAEERLADRFPQIISDHNSKNPDNPAKKIEVTVKMSPCKGQCTPRLIELKNQHPHLDWHIYYKWLYEPDPTEKEKSAEGIEMMKQAGLKVMEFDEAVEAEKLRKGK